METEKDYEEFLELLNKHDVKYCIVGAFALAFHAEPRYTKDIDIWVQAGTENAEKLLLALDEFGFGSLDLNAEDFSIRGNIIQLGYEPVRIDIITSIQGLDFNDIWQNRVQGSYGRQTVNFIDRENLIKSKKISNRPRTRPISFDYKNTINSLAFSAPTIKFLSSFVLPLEYVNISMIYWVSLTYQ